MIKRRYANLLFGLTGAALVCAVATQTLRLHRHTELVNALDSLPGSLKSLDDVQIANAVSQHPSVQISLASALANGGNLAEAERILNVLITESGDSAIVRGAQYNLGNAYLRQAIGSSDGNDINSRSLPLVELAKQRYRELLRDFPDHWLARYNLERALRLAPEGSDRALTERIDPVKRVNVVVPGFEKKDLP